ncbi:putative serine/threonine-protein kinase [Euphorbia lathyris]|uniref:putative serine/threonine-protein kinase n=1 Tax=Euphorbia lathyris TaxID=212925 RepID=UPI0033144115
MKFQLCGSSCFSFSNSKSTIDTTISGLNRHENLIIFSSQELEIATHGFSSSNKIGEGAFGCVYKGRLADGCFVGVKKLSVDIESMRGEREFISELAALSNISHENLVKLRGCCVDGANRFLVYEYMENKSLAQTLLGKEEKRVKLSWETRRDISIGVAKGLAYLHEEVQPHILHRDIKASNILLDHNFTPKLGDFGLSRILRDNTSHVSTRVAGTLGYLAPEYAISGQLTRKSDVYGFGVVLMEIISGRSAIDFDLQLGEHYLVQKAWEAYKEEKILEVVDPSLNMNFPEKEALRFLIVSLLCVQETAKLRPNMSTAAKMLSNETEVMGDIEIGEPGLLSDLMDIRLHHKHISQTSSSRPSSISFSTANFFS